MPAISKLTSPRRAAGAVIMVQCALALAIATSTCGLLFAVEFREIDGCGNNPFFVTQGAANTRVIRFGYNADYPDGIGDVITESVKPNPRDVSNTVIAQTSSIVNNRGLSDWVVQWGQFLTHDISLVPTSTASNVLSTGATGDFNIPVNDPSDMLWPGPIAFNRSVFDPATGNGEVMMTDRGPVPIPRWQINSNTSYIDASNVYGSNSTTAAALRTYSDGKLATSAGGLLPMVDAGGKFLAGDERANENVSLSATHALFIREHNRLAELIKAHDDTLSDGEIYQWARKIVGAEMQAITYREFLPALMGDGAPAASEYAYDESANASITTAFSTAAFRYGHSMQSSKIMLVNDAGSEVGEISLSDAASPNSILRDDPAKVALVLKGLATQAAQENDAYVIDELRNIRFGPPGAGGTDLAAVDIQRGRDHGLIDNYRQLRIAYNLAPLSHYEQLTSDVSLQTELASAYGPLDNLDAWVAMIAEDHVDGSSLGRLAQTIVISQFERLRDGDRFFFTGDPDLESSLVTSIIDLNSLTLGQLIELNTGMTNLQDNVFFAVAAVPEPSTAVLIIAGAVLAWLSPRRRRQLPSRHRRSAVGSCVNQEESLMMRTISALLAPSASLALLLSAPMNCHAVTETEYYTFMDDYHSNPSTTDATGEAFFTLNSDHTELSYTIVFDGLLGLKANEAERTEPDDITGVHLHLHVPDALGPHVLNIFGWPAEEDAELVVDYANNTLTGVYDISDATIDPATGEPALQFYPLTTKIIDDWIDDLAAGDLMLAVHTNESGVSRMAIYGHIGSHEHVVPEPCAAGMLAIGWFLSCFTRGRSFESQSRR